MVGRPKLSRRSNTIIDLSLVTFTAATAAAKMKNN
jgi:hypothetical protein